MMAMAAGLVVLAGLHGEGLRAAIAILGAYCVARLIVHGLPLPWELLALFALWVAVGRYVARSGFSNAGGLLIACGLCYLWARLTGAPRVVGSLPFVASDVLAGVAMLMMGGRFCAAFVGGRFVGWRLD